MNNKSASNGKAPHAGAAVIETPEAEKEKSATEVNENGQLNGNTHEAPAPLTIDEKISKLQNLVDLVENRDKFRNHLSQVEGIRFGDLDEKCLITVATEGGKSYPIKSSYLCQKIATLLKDEFTGKIKEIEAQINF